MTEVMKAIYSFLTEAAGIPVYPENGVPSDAVFPYLTYPPIKTDWDTDGVMPTRIWDKSTSYRRISSIVDKIEKIINDDITIRTDTGYIYLYRGTPWAQTQPLQDSEVKVMYINIGINTMIP